MTFLRAEMLLFIWAVPVLLLLIVTGMRRRREILNAFASGHGLRVIAPHDASGRRWVKGALILAALLLTAVALAGPRYGYRWQEVRQRGVEIIVALDCSRSMTAADIPPNRLERAKREVFDLLAMLQGDRVGLVAFAGTAFLQCPLTLDYGALNLFLTALSPDFLPVGGTDISAALKTAVDSFDPRGAADRAVILITDGENTGAEDPIKMAKALKEKEIKLFSIGVGGREGVPIPEPDGGFKKDRDGRIVLSRLDEDTLKRMSLATGGTYVRSVAGDMDLDTVYTDEIRGKMDAETVTSGRRQVEQDRFQWPLALAVIFLAIELLLPVTRRGVTPLLIAALMLWPAPVAANDTRSGIAAYEKGDFEQARKHFIDAQRNAPDTPAVLYNVAGAYYQTGDFDAAADHYQQVLLAGDAPLMQKTLYNLGNTEYRRGNLEAAIDRYEAALAMDPEDRRSRENLEFVKQALAQQKQQQSGKSGDTDRRENTPEEGSESGRPSPNDRSENALPPPQRQQEADNDPQHGDGEQQRAAFGSERRRQEPKNGPSQTPATAPTEAAPADRHGPDPGQAERLLNRLQDQPGRALMPVTGDRKGEKDW